jgi:hypothetical protein
MCHLFGRGTRLLHLMHYLLYGIFVCPIVEAFDYQLITDINTFTASYLNPQQL